ncbi:MAG: hypothetical protein ACE37I_00565 [Rubinisphaera brasiliensis]|uniref:Uncharacterized protein n=1 Tax=Rubinisphaera brasiliensis (strain ATCC 49424 / DSM 5305 / JCM 21570 / IAM 15109 / NBRC 103401 / IFAM 1448) TaxID=756272 RepID=F0SFL9_RUBBR|nr:MULTISPECIES: hypothetical protein [Rubinisphaera]ADY60479.1 hypothetical protein Plabr_2880 [Rubinisphaera brasiliensis DSM 5305]MBR9803399.1 hypothetical protein [bacterium]
MRNTDVLQLELEVGQTLFIGNVAVTIIDSEGDEVSLKIDDDEDSMFPIRLAELVPQVPK